MTLDELMIKITGETSSLHASTTSASKDVEKLGKNSVTQGGKVSKSFDDAGGHASKFGGVLSGIAMGVGLGLFSIAEEGLSKLTGVITNAGAAYEDAQTSEAQFATALKDQHIPAAKAADAAMQSNIAHFESLGFSADETRSSMALLLGQTHNLAGANTELSDAADLARLKGISLASAQNVIERAMEGSTAGLKKYGINVAKGSSQTQILADIEKAAGGQADAYAAGPAGRLAAAHQKVTEEMVKVGAITDQITTAVMPALADAFGNVVDAVSPLITQLSAQMPAIMATAGQMFDTLRGAVTGVANAIMPLVEQVIPPMLSFVQSITSDGDKMAAVLGIIGGVVLAVVVPPFVAWAAATLAATWPIIAIIAGVAALIVVLDKLGILKTIGAVMKDLAAKVLPALSTAFDFISKTVMPAVQTAIQFVTDTVIPALSAAFNWIAVNIPPVLKAAFDIITQTILPALSAAFDWIVKNVIPPLVAAFKTISDFVTTTVVPVIATITDFFVNTLAPAMSTVIKTVIPPLVAVFKTVSDFISTTVVPALKTITDFFSKTVAPAVSTIVKTVVPPLVAAFKTISDFLTKTLFPVFSSFVKTVLPPIKTAIEFITSTVLPALGTAIGIAQTAFSTLGTVVGTIWSGISTAVKGAVNIVIGAVDAIIEGINKIQFHIDLKPPIGPELKFDYNGPHISTIPTLHAGGIVPGPAGSDVLAMLQAGERVTPAGKGGGGNTINLIVNNPTPEAASTSIQHELLKLASLGYMGG